MLYPSFCRKYFRGDWNDWKWKPVFAPARASCALRIFRDSNTSRALYASKFVVLKDILWTPFEVPGTPLLPVVTWSFMNNFRSLTLASLLDSRQKQFVKSPASLKHSKSLEHSNRWIDFLHISIFWLFGKQTLPSNATAVCLPPRVRCSTWNP